MTVSEVCMYE